MLNFKKIMINIPILQQKSNIISKALKVLKENDLNLPLFDLELKTSLFPLKWGKKL